MFVRSASLALVASSAVIASADAFWLIPGSTNRDASEIAAEQSVANRFRSAFAEKYAAVADAASNVIPTGSHKAAATPSVMDDLMRAFDEVSADVGYSASVAKGTLGRGIYMRQNEDTYLLAMDVAGLHTREVSITAEKGTLRIKGEKKCPNHLSTNKPDPLCIPRYYDASFTFPSDPDEEKADGKLDAGVVRVFVPKIKGPRGVGRVIKLTGDAADWAYTESGAKRVVDTTSDGVNSAAASVAAAAAEASASAAAAYDSAANTVHRVVDNVVDSVYGAADHARIAADSATENAKAAGAAATESIKSAGAEATAAASRASAAAAASASSVSASIASAGKSLTGAAAASASSASRSASSMASVASKSAKSAASQASATGAAATASAKSAAAHATETGHPSFVERLSEQVKAAKERIYPTGAAEGSVPVKKEEL